MFIEFESANDGNMHYINTFHIVKVKKQRQPYFGGRDLFFVVLSNKEDIEVTEETYQGIKSALNLLVKGST